MPRYYFNLFNDLVSIDDEGRTLDGPAAARAFAVANIRALISEDVQKGSLNLGHRVEILDAPRVKICTVRFADALAIVPAPPDPPETGATRGH